MRVDDAAGNVRQALPHGEDARGLREGEHKHGVRGGGGARADPPHGRHVAEAGVKRRKLKLKATFESTPSCFSVKRLDPGAFYVGFTGSTCTALPGGDTGVTPAATPRATRASVPPAATRNVPPPPGEPDPKVWRRKLKLKATFESSSSNFSFKLLDTGAFNGGLIGSTCTALPRRPGGPRRRPPRPPPPLPLWRSPARAAAREWRPPRRRRRRRRTAARRRRRRRRRRRARAARAGTPSATEAAPPRCSGAS